MVDTERGKIIECVLEEIDFSRIYTSNVIIQICKLSSLLFLVDIISRK